MTMAAMRAPYPLWSANTDRSEITAFYQQPQFPAGQLSAQPAVRKALEETIRTSHGGQIEADQLQAMLAIQQQRDRRMAERLLAAPTPALLIAGGYHAAKSVGAAARAGSATGGGADGADVGGAGRTGRCEHRRLPVDHTISEMNTLRQ